MSDFIIKLEEIIRQRRQGDPAVSYVAGQLQGDPERLYRKLPEEATEVVLGCLLSQDRGKITEESADLLFQLLILLAKHEISFQDVLDELERRHSQSGGETASVAGESAKVA